MAKNFKMPDLFGFMKPKSGDGSGGGGDSGGVGGEGGSDGSGGGSGDGSGAATQQAKTKYSVFEPFATAVETVSAHAHTAGEKTKQKFGDVFKPMAKQMEGKTQDISDTSRGVVRQMDEAWKKKIREAKVGAARLGVVFAEPLDIETELKEYKAPNHPKLADETVFIYEALKDAVLFAKLGDDEKRMLINAFEQTSAVKGEKIIEQGDKGDYFYIIAEGKVKFEVDGEEVGKAGKGEGFGELALLYDAPRAATCIAETECSLWRVDQLTFRRIVASYKIKFDTETTTLLKKVDFLKDLDDESLTKVAYMLDKRQVKAGEVLLKKGESAHHFYIVVEGHLKGTDVTLGDKKLNDFDMRAGENVGGNHILKGRPMVGNLVAAEDTTVLSMAADHFKRVCGDYEDLIRKASDRKMLTIIPIATVPKTEDILLDQLTSVIVNVGYKKGHVFYKRGDEIHPALFLIRSGEVTVEGEDGTTKTQGAMGYFGEETVEETLEGKVTARFTVTVTEDVMVGVLGSQAITTVMDSSKPKECTICMEDIERHRILGAGTFGQVWLVSKKGTKDAYALKVQFKRKLIESNQVKGVVREKNIMARLDSPFIIKLVCSYQDVDNVYMLMKLYQGGELWSVMHGEEYNILPEKVAKFYAASILEGLSYMHHRRVLYRDLKPENVLLDSEGFTVIVDLGFAKHVKDKTYTFCGTPLYLAPEVILQRGHDKGADHWSWGVLVYEMICGITPFYDKKIDQMTLYKRIINQKYRFPSGDFISRESKDLIKRILVVDPYSRLGSLAGADEDIKEHAWFRGVNFEKLHRREMTPPWVPEVDDPLDVSNFDNWDHLKDKKQEGEPLTKEEQKQFERF